MSVKSATISKIRCNHMKKLLLLFLIAGLTGCATADQPSSVKLLKLNYDKSYPVDIWMESGENQVGAYTVTL